MSADDRIDQLWSIHQIRQLAYRYAYAVDTRDLDLCLSLWVDAEPVAYPTVDRHRIRELWRDLDEVGASVLFVGNHLIDFDSPDHARGSVYCLAHCDCGTSTPNTRGNVFYEQAILYQDVYERHDGEWLFRKRDHLLWWGEEKTPNPMHQPPANWPASEVGAGDAFERIRATAR